MYVFVSWAYLSEAEAAEQRRLAWVDQLKADGQDKLAEELTTEFCLPEYANYLKALEAVGDSLPPSDVFNGNLLAIRFVIPALERVATYQLAKRLPGSGKLPVSVASRSLLLNSFDGVWVGEKSLGTSNVVKFVGLNGTREFFEQFALACAALNEPLPFDLWRQTEVIDLLADDKARGLLDACVARCTDDKETAKYRKLLLGWLGSGASADRDSAVTVAAGLKLGLK